MKRACALMAAAVGGFIPAASGEAVVRVGDPVPFDWFTTCDEARFFTIDDGGVLYGITALCDQELPNRVIRAAGTDIEVIPDTTGEMITGFNAANDGGGQVLVSAWASFGPGECSSDPDLVYSTSRDMLFDLTTGSAEFLAPLCPSFLGVEISADGGTVVGIGKSLPPDEWTSWAAVWRAGNITDLTVPEVDGYGSPKSSLARSVSDDGAIIAGSAHWAGEDGAPPLNHAIVWSDLQPVLLPHYDGVDPGPAGSWVFAVSGDGSTILGSTGVYEFVPGTDGYPDRWVIRSTTDTRSRT